jgi:hypothetical protein
MTPRSPGRILALLFAILVTVGMSLSVVQANGMATKMAMASEMGTSGHGGCDVCPAGGDGAKVPACSPMCVPPVLLMLQQVALVLPESISTSFAVRSDQLHGRVSPPDPSPPRSTSIG